MSKRSVIPRRTSPSPCRPPRVDCHLGAAGKSCGPGLDRAWRERPDARDAHLGAAPAVPYGVASNLLVSLLRGDGRGDLVFRVASPDAALAVRLRAAPNYTGPVTGRSPAAPARLRRSAWFSMPPAHRASQPWRRRRRRPLDARFATSPCPTSGPAVSLARRASTAPARAREFRRWPPIRCRPRAGPRVPRTERMLIRFVPMAPAPNRPRSRRPDDRGRQKMSTSRVAPAAPARCTLSTRSRLVPSGEYLVDNLRHERSGEVMSWCLFRPARICQRANVKGKVQVPRSSGTTFLQPSLRRHARIHRTIHRIRSALLNE